MNFVKRHNVFSDIPGFDASKGERIVKALQRLWEKIERLEQIRNFERNSKSKEELSSSIDEATIFHVDNCKKCSSPMQVLDPTLSDVRYKLLILQLQYVRGLLRKTTIPRETQTRALSPPTKDTRVSEAVVSLPPNTKKSGDPKPHYHMKLDDVPFILAASSGTSHSVVANMQNIIALLKTHNRALCGAPTKQQQEPMTRTLINRNPQQLATKRGDVTKTADAVQTGQKQVPKERRRKKVTRCRSKSEPSALPANERKPANERAGRLTTNPPIAARRQFLRNLQNVKSFLSKEDISWD